MKKCKLIFKKIYLASAITFTQIFLREFFTPKIPLGAELQGFLDNTADTRGIYYAHAPLGQTFALNTRIELVLPLGQ
jgi:membrane-anchored glycerophosphoryl diester phosphodiesterase (GDPDase)